MARSAHILITLAILSLAPVLPARAWLPADPVADPLFQDILKLENSRDTGPALQEFTRHSSAPVRARALRALARAQDEALAPVFAGALADPDPAVRHEAALGMGLLWEKGNEEALIGAFATETDPRVREALVEAVGRTATTGKGVPFLSEIAAGDDTTLAARAAISLGIAGFRGIDIKGGVTGLTAATRSKNARVRWSAAYAFFRGRPEESHRYARPLLNDSDPIARIYAIRAIAAGKKTELAEPVAQLMRDSDWRVRVEAIKAMIPLKGGVLISLLGLAVEDPNPLVQYTAIVALGDLRLNHGLSYLERILEESDDWRLRGAAIVARTRIEGDGALPALQRLKDSPEWQIRRATAEAFGLLKSDQARKILSEMTVDKNNMVLATVASSLRDYPQVLALNDLKSTLKSDDIAVITNAASALGQRGDRTAIAPLAETYSRLKAPADVEPMVEILRALGTIVTPEDSTVVNGELTAELKGQAVATLEAGLKDPERNVATAAAEALQRITGTDRSAEIPAASTGEFPLYLEEIQAEKPSRARFVTARGEIVIEFLPGAAPNTVANFTRLALQGYFNNLTFHRVVPDFVTQDGCPRGDGWGGPGHAIRCEYNDLRYETGTVGMALSGKDTGGSQYFITHSPQPHLDGKYTIFGRVVSGMDVFSKILMGDTIERVEMIPS